MREKNMMQENNYLNDSFFVILIIGGVYMKNAVLLIVGVLIGLAIGIFGGYYYFENFSDKKFSKEVKQEEKKKEEPKEETKVWTDEEVQNILSLFFKNT